MPSRVIAAASDTFGKIVLSGQATVLVDFMAPWCGPCKLLAPLLDEVAEEYANELVVVKVDIDASQALAERYLVRSVPTLMLFRGGTETARSIGMLSKTRLAAFLDSHL